MAFVTPTNVTVGSVLTASKYNQEVVANGLAGQPIFTNEAARDAVITSPSEGMVAYLTAPTVPAATGGTTMLPTGVRTIYNGSVWVCVTPVSARQTASGTLTSGSFTPTLSGSPGTNPSVTLVTGTTALIAIRATIVCATSGQGGFATVAVSGATTKAASADDAGIFFRAAASNQDANIGTTVVLDGLTAGTNTFTMEYASTGGATSTISRRNLTVQGIA